MKGTYRLELQALCLAAVNAERCARRRKRQGQPHMSMPDVDLEPIGH